MFPLFLDHAFGALPNPRSQILSPFFFSFRSLIILGFAYIFMIHYKLIFNDVTYESKVIFLHMNIQIFPHGNNAEKTVFFIDWPLLKITLPCMCRAISEHFILFH